MAEDWFEILTRFHREVVLPDIKRVWGELRDEMNARFTALDTRFDAVYQRLDRLEGLLAEGTQVAVTAGEVGAPLELSPADEAALSEAIVEADRGDVISATELLPRL